MRGDSPCMRRALLVRQVGRASDIYVRPPIVIKVSANRYLVRLSAELAWRAVHYCRLQTRLVGALRVTAIVGSSPCNKATCCGTLNTPHTGQITI